jgi:large subunit ribosomal protein L31
MKSEIHPKLVACDVVCACGNKFQTRAIKDAIRIDICNVCHPFFTGKLKLMDVEGRVERFNRKYSKK